MKFEKLNENKIRLTLNNQDLIEKNINFNSFMSNSTEAQNCRALKGGIYSAFLFDIFIS